MKPNHHEHLLMKPNHPEHILMKPNHHEHLLMKPNHPEHILMKPNHHEHLLMKPNHHEHLLMKPNYHEHLLMKINHLNPLVTKAIFFIRFQKSFKHSFIWVNTEFHFFNFLGGINVPFRNGINEPAALFYRLRNGINMLSLGKRGEYWPKTAANC